MNYNWKKITLYSLMVVLFFNFYDADSMNKDFSNFQIDQLNKNYNNRYCLTGNEIGVVNYSKIIDFLDSIKNTVSIIEKNIASQTGYGNTCAQFALLTGVRVFQEKKVTKEDIKKYIGSSKMPGLLRTLIINYREENALKAYTKKKLRDELFSKNNQVNFTNRSKDIYMSEL